MKPNRTYGREHEAREHEAAATPAVTDITSRAMIARLTISQWTARKYDRRVSREAAAAYSVPTDAGRYNKALIATDALRDISASVSAIRTYHYSRTLPWTDEGARLLPAAAYLDYCDELSNLRSVFAAAVDRFVAAYPQLVDDARVRLKGMFVDGDYPPVDAIGQRFAFDVAIAPIPAAGDFRVAISAEESARIQADIARRSEEAVSAAMRDVWTRVMEAVTHMHERLQAYGRDDAGRVTAPFRDSLVDNLRELVDIVPQLNVTADPQLEEMVVALRRDLCAHDADTLRIDDRKREHTAAAARKILDSMREYVGEVR